MSRHDCVAAKLRASRLIFCFVDCLQWLSMPTDTVFLASVDVRLATGAHRRLDR